MVDPPTQESLGDSLKTEGDVGDAEMVLRENTQGIGEAYFLRQLGCNLRHGLGRIDKMNGFPDNILEVSRNI
jgi:hypothetical protein